MDQIVEMDRQEKEILEFEANKQFEIWNLNFPKFVYQMDLSFTEAKVLCFIITYASQKFFFSNDQLAKMFKTSTKTISRSITKLKNLDLINVKYSIKANGGTIRFISWSPKLVNLMKGNFDGLAQVDINGSHNETLMSRPTGHECPTKEYKIKDNNINNNKPPLKDTTIPPFKKGEDVNIFFSGGNYLNQKSENSLNEPNLKIDLSEGECPSGEGSGLDGTLTTPKQCNAPNWEDCKNDVQRLIAFWVRLEHPDLYQGATREQKREFFRRFARDASSILKMAGNLKIAMDAVLECRGWLMEKGLEYNLSTIARNIATFVDDIINESQLPNADPDLVAEYHELYKLATGKEISPTKFAEAVRKKMKESGNDVNKIIEDGISRLKQMIGNIMNKEARENVEIGS